MIENNYEIENGYFYIDMVVGWWWLNFDVKI